MLYEFQSKSLMPISWNFYYIKNSNSTTEIFQMYQRLITEVRQVKFQYFGKKGISNSLIYLSVKRKKNALNFQEWGRVRMKLPYSHNFFSENVTSDLKGANATSFPLLENEKGMRGWRRKGVFNLCFCFCLFYFTL